MCTLILKCEDAMNILRTLYAKRTGAQWSASFQGNIDGLHDRSIIGWVRKRDEPDAQRVDVFVNDMEIAKNVTANLYRADVKEAGFGSGHFGFECQLPDTIQSGEIEIVIRESDGHRKLLQRRLQLHSKDSHQTDTGEFLISESNATLSGETYATPVLNSSKAPKYDLRIERLTETKLRGWAVDRNDPGRIFPVELWIDEQPFQSLRNDQSRRDLERAQLSKGRGGVAADIPLNLLEPGEHKVTLRLPDGTTEDRIVSTVGHPSGVALDSNVPIPTKTETAIIVPVYNAADDLRVCIKRLVDYTSDCVEILLIDDFSSDPEIQKILREAEQYRNFRTLQNSKNLGFTGTVNRGLELIGRKHAVLLNSDARVTPGWLEGMLRAAAARPRVATVTAMSDRAGAFSAPNMGNENELPPGVDEITYARAFRRRGLGLYPTVPTGNGFCMFVNRACLDEIGGLDAAAFPRGYGEENDFCMRAGRAGWCHLIDDRTYVFHDRSKSFGEAKQDLVLEGRAVIDVRYPEYKNAISVFGRDMKIQTARFQAKKALHDCNDPRTSLPRTLFVVATQTGGTPQTNLDLMEALSDGTDSWLMRCDSRQIVLYHFRENTLQEVRHHELSETLEPIRHVSGEYDKVVADWLEYLDIDIVHIRHIAWHSLNLPKIAKDKGCRVVFSFHDFYTVCPTVKMLRPRNDDPVGGRPGASNKPELWSDVSMPPLTDEWCQFWRDRFDGMLSNCDQFVTTSHSAKSTIIENLPNIDGKRFHVIPHGRDFDEFRNLRVRPHHGTPLRILVPGNISMAKGLGVIRDLLEIDKSELLEIHILGKIDDSHGISHPRLKLHGTYNRNDFARKVASIKPHLGAVFSVWDETFCHTLTELWSVGVPPIVFDFATVAGRVRETGAGWVMPHLDVNELYQEIITTAFDTAEQDRVENAISAWQTGSGAGQSTRLMAAKYQNVYRLAKDLPTLPIVGLVAPTSQTLTSTNASTEIRMWERTRYSHTRQVIYVRMTPNSLLANLKAGELRGAILQRNAIPATLVNDLLEAFKDSKIKYLLDLDDNLLTVPEDKDPTGQHAAYAPKLEQLIRRAEIVTVSTEPLRTHLELLNNRIAVMPNRLSDPLWRGSLKKRVNDGTIRCLYFDSSTHSENLNVILPALEVIASNHSDFRLSTIGIHHETDLPVWMNQLEVPDKIKSYAEFVLWLRSQTEHFDFAVAPLQSSLFNPHKCGLEIIEGAALGLPVLASDLPIYENVCRLIPEARLVKNNKRSWIAAIEAAIKEAKVSGPDRSEIRHAVFPKLAMSSSAREFDQLLLDFI